MVMLLIIAFLSGLGTFIVSYDTSAKNAWPLMVISVVCSVGWMCLHFAGFK